MSSDGKPTWVPAASAFWLLIFYSTLWTALTYACFKLYQSHKLSKSNPQTKTPFSSLLKFIPPIYAAMWIIPTLATVYTVLTSHLFFIFQLSEALILNALGVWNFAILLLHPEMRKVAKSLFCFN
jgi:hypothetical protein